MGTSIDNRAADKTPVPPPLNISSRKRLIDEIQADDDQTPILITGGKPPNKNSLINQTDETFDN